MRDKIPDKKAIFTWEPKADDVAYDCKLRCVCALSLLSLLLLYTLDYLIHVWHILTAQYALLALAVLSDKC